MSFFSRAGHVSKKSFVFAKKKVKPYSDTAMISAIKSINAFKGYFSGTVAYQNTLDSLKTFYAKEFYETNVEVKDLRIMSRSAKNIEKYEHFIEKAQVDYFNDPEGMRRHLDKLFSHLSKDLESFVSAYESFSRKIYDQIIVTLREVGFENQSLYNLLITFYTTLKKKELYVPPEVVKEAHHQISVFLKSEYRIAKKDEKKDEKEESVLSNDDFEVEAPHFIGFKMFFFKHRVLKDLKNSESKALNDLKGNLKFLLDSLNNGNLDTGIFLSKFKEHLKNLRKTNVYFFRLIDDLLSILGLSQNDYDVVFSSLSKIISMSERFRSSEVISSFKKRVVELHSTLLSEVNKFSKDFDYIETQLKTFKRNSDRIFSWMKTYSEKFVERLEKSPEKAFSRVS